MFETASILAIVQARAASKGKEGAGAAGIEADGSQSTTANTEPSASAPRDSAAQLQPAENGHAEPAHGEDVKKRRIDEAGAAQEPTSQHQAEQNGHAAAGVERSKKRKPEPIGKQEQHQRARVVGVEAPGTTGREMGDGIAGSAAKSPKWKKLAVEVLQGRKDRRMKVAKLQRTVLAAAGLGAEALSHHGNVMVQRWSNSKQFAVQDGYVVLA